MKSSFIILVLLLVAQTALAQNPMYKPSSRSPAAIDITTNEYGFSRSAPGALGIGDTAPDFTLPRAGGGVVQLSELRNDGPVAIIFYRGHW